MMVTPKSKSSKSLKTQGFISLKCSVLFSYFVSLASCLFLIVIFYLSDLDFKILNGILNCLVILCVCFSLKFLLHQGKQGLIKYMSFTKFLQIAIILLGFFNFFNVAYLVINNSDNDLIYYYIPCIVAWFAFHGLFLYIIKSYIKKLEDRPAEMRVKSKEIDKNLQDLMLNTSNDNNN